MKLAEFSINLYDFKNLNEMNELGWGWIYYVYVNLFICEDDFWDEMIECSQFDEKVDFLMNF